MINLVWDIFKDIFSHGMDEYKTLIAMSNFTILLQNLGNLQNVTKCGVKVEVSSVNVWLNFSIFLFMCAAFLLRFHLSVMLHSVSVCHGTRIIKKSLWLLDGIWNILWQILVNLHVKIYTKSNWLIRKFNFSLNITWLVTHIFFFIQFFLKILAFHSQSDVACLKYFSFFAKRLITSLLLQLASPIHLK